MCTRAYKLDPAHYLSAPQLSFDAALRETRMKLELVSDPRMFEMIDSGIRGGVAMISHRYARANNPGVDDYDPEKPTSYIKGVDANNLYGWAMSQPLPYEGFEWMAPSELESIDWKAQLDDQAYGYILKVDLDYPQELHDLHNDYPLAPERLIVKDEWLSEKQVNLRVQYKMGRTDLATKLIPNLLNKRNYVIHYRVLKFYLAHGLILKKVHAGIKFLQSSWLAGYIRKNQEMRAQASNDEEADFYKLMNNSLYGKTVENLKKRTNIKLVQDIKKLQELINKPHLLDVRVFSEELAAVELQKTQLRIDRQFYIGFTVLDLAKLHMYSYASIVTQLIS